MQVDVIVMLNKTNRTIMDWQLKTDSRGELRVVGDARSSQTPEKKWRDLALKINRQALNGDQDLQLGYLPVEVILYLPDGLLSCSHDYGTLERIAAAVRNHAWAGKIYVAWDKVPATALSSEFDELNLLTKCFCGLLNQRVSDLIEITRQDKPTGALSFEEKARILRGRVVSSEKRRDELRTLVSDDGWSYVVRNESRLLESLLSEFVRLGCVPRSSPNNLIIFDAPPRFGPRELFDKFMRVRPSGKGVVAATVESYAEVAKYYCGTEPPAAKILEFNGIFEIIFALLQLNDCRRKTRANLDVAAHVERQRFSAAAVAEIEGVAVSERPVFGPATAQSQPRVLITSAFDEPFHIQAAAAEVGGMLLDLPFGIDVEVHPCISCESFPDLLESRQFTAWIHLSHGNEGGLYDPRLRMFVPPERWLNCFKVYRGSLSLALFSSCHSASAARLFAAAGVGVAIGFEDSVLVDATAILVQKVVAAAVRSGSDHERILAAFDDACVSLSARTQPQGMRYSDAQPAAFRSLRN